MSVSNSVAKALTVVCAVFFLFTMAPDADSTVLKSVNLTLLTTQADLIFSGKVVDMKTRWDSTHSSLWTYVTFAVDEIIKGASTQKEITLKLPGGTIKSENIRLKVDGVPQFSIGQESIVFSSSDARRICPIIGWCQGRFKLRYDKVSGKKLVDDKRAGRILQKRGVLSADQGPETPVIYKNFVDDIKKIMGQKSTDIEKNGGQR